MNHPKPVNPNYTETEVWDMLTDYLVKKHLATASSVQRGIYADFHKDGSTFLVGQCEDEFALLYCYRNLNFNISGNIIYQLAEEYSEEFNLHGICEFLGLPFPKEVSLVELNQSEIDLKNENRRIAEDYQNKQAQRNQHKSRIQSTLIAMFYAFEYDRARPLSGRAFHYSQLTREAQQSRFVQNNRLQHISEVLALSPCVPSEQEFLDYVRHQTYTSRYMNLDHAEVEENAARMFHQRYHEFFPKQVRRVGGLLYPLRNLQGEVISALNVVDIKKDDDQNGYVLMQHKVSIIGTVQFAQDSQIENLVVITQDLTTADIIKTLLPHITVQAALSAKNLTHAALSLAQNQPDLQVVVYLNDDYGQIRTAKNTLQFKDSSIRLLAGELVDQGEPNNLGTLSPAYDEATGYSSLNEIYLNEPLPVCQAYFKQLLDGYIERHQNGESELTHLLGLHQQWSEILKDELKISLPVLVEPKVLQDQATLPHPMIFAIGGNSVLFQESRADLKKWFAEPASDEMQQAQQAWADQVGTFALLSEELSEEEIETIQKHHQQQGSQFGEIDT